MTALVETGRYEGCPSIGSPFLNRDSSEEGKVVSYKDCTLTSCGGRCIGVRWPDGTLTWPCSKGCRVTPEGTWKVA